MYDYHAVEALLGMPRRSLFPNAGTDAYCDLQSQTIHLNRIRKAIFEQDRRERRLSALRPQFATMLHELTHWADLVGTLWGREYLCAVYDALRLIDAGVHEPGAEANFHRFVDLYDQTRRIMMSSYYRTENPAPRPHNHRHTWVIQFSAGKEFDTAGRIDDARPVVFATFLDNASGVRIARQPIVTGALLEVNAVWSEIRANLEVIHLMETEERISEERLFRIERLERLYDPGQTLYTAPAHMLAQFAKLTNVIDAYRLASAVSHIVLNLGESDFLRLTPPPEFENWSNLFDGFRARRDRGFAYAVICAHGGPWAEGRDEGEWLDEALSGSGLSTSAEIVAAASDRMRADVVEDEKTSIGRAEHYLLSLGERVLAIRGAGDTALTAGRLAEEKLPTPPMFDFDGELIELPPGVFDTSCFSPEAAHAEAAALHTWTTNLLGACR